MPRIKTTRYNPNTGVRRHPDSGQLVSLQHVGNYEHDPLWAEVVSVFNAHTARIGDRVEILVVRQNNLGDVLATFRNPTPPTSDGPVQGEWRAERFRLL